MDFETSEEADDAVKKTNGVIAWGVQIRVGQSTERGPKKVAEREEWEVEQVLKEKYRNRAQRVR